MFFCIHYMNYTRMFKEEKEHAAYVIHIMYTKEHVYKFLIHQVVIQHSTYKRNFECCMTTWCIKNLYTCSFVYIIWITPECSFSFFYILSVVWQLDVLRTCIHVLLYTLHELHKQHVLFLSLHQVVIQHSTYKRKKKNMLLM
jgi:hypothetical protein